MNLIHSLLATMRPREERHPILGRMMLMKMPAGVASYWEAEYAFGATGANIEVFVDAPEGSAPPAPAQIDFLDRLDTGYSKVFDTVCTALRPEFERHTNRPFPDLPRAEFRLSAVDVPPCRTDDERWALYFDSDIDAQHPVIAHMLGHKVFWVQIGG